MCGRYYSLFDEQQVAEHFHVRRTADNVGIIAPNYNVAPGDPQPSFAAAVIPESAS
jgi:putative SOS response-associated peptidase YedK